MSRKFRISGIMLLVVVSLLLAGCNPSYELTGVEHGKIYNEAVTPVVIPEEGATVSLLLNTLEFENGTTISADGNHVLTIINEENQNVIDTIEFTIETGAPEIAFSGVVDGKYYAEALIPEIIIGEDNDRTGIDVTATLNGATYVEGDLIEAHDQYALVVTATKNNQTRVATLKFEIGEPLFHEFSITDSLTGFQGDRTDLAYNTDPQYIKSGDGSLRVTRNGSDTRGLRVNRHGDHPDWLNNWSEYSKITASVYVEDKTKLADEPFGIRLYDLGDGGGPGVVTYIPLTEIENGWNLLEFDLITVLDVKADRITNMVPSLMLEFIIKASGDSVVVYYDEIRLVM